MIGEASKWDNPQQMDDDRTSLNATGRCFAQSTARGQCMQPNAPWQWEHRTGRASGTCLVYATGRMARIEKVSPGLRSRRERGSPCEARFTRPKTSEKYLMKRLGQSRRPYGTLVDSYTAPVTFFHRLCISQVTIARPRSHSVLLGPSVHRNAQGTRVK